MNTIIALSTAPGVGAISVIRLSGDDAFEIIDKIFLSKKLSEQKSHTAHFGKIVFENKEIDEVVATIFKGPYSYTKENVIEISCHGSPYIVQQIMEALLANGASLAKAGEFTMRAFLNGRMDLSQAEAVADLIASESAATHRMAMQQMRGGVSSELKVLRQELIDYAALIELELDFGEEDVEFANREKLISLIDRINEKIKSLAQSFQKGNAMKNGIPTAIVGKPNAGKSTLLNALLNDEKAIVSPIAGTTRDVVEDKISINGILFRLMDTAGLRESTDTIEQEGVLRSKAKAQQARLVLYVFDISEESIGDVSNSINELALQDDVQIICVANKVDINNIDITTRNGLEIIKLSAKNKSGLKELENAMTHNYLLSTVNDSDVTVSNIRHYDALNRAIESLNRAKENLQKEVSGELVAFELRDALQSLGEITGEVSNEEVLGSIFSKFCIGK